MIRRKVNLWRISSQWVVCSFITPYEMWSLFIYVTPMRGPSLSYCECNFLAFFFLISLGSHHECSSTYILINPQTMLLATDQVRVCRQDFTLFITPSLNHFQKKSLSLIWIYYCVFSVEINWFMWNSCIISIKLLHLKVAQNISSFRLTTTFRLVSSPLPVSSFCCHITSRFHLQPS